MTSTSATWGSLVLVPPPDAPPASHKPAAAANDDRAPTGTPLGCRAAVHMTIDHRVSL